MWCQYGVNMEADFWGYWTIKANTDSREKRHHGTQSKSEKGAGLEVGSEGF